MSVVLDKSPVKYYGTRLSDNIARTPEGFLICKNSIIGRTGSQKYLASELDDPDGLVGDRGPGDEVEVWRSADEVFSDPTMASFEGKSFIVRHPPNGQLLDPDTDKDHSVGHVQNVHKGPDPLDTGDWPMLGDIIVKDGDAIRRVLDGERELSCGYSYRLYKNGDKLEQRNIVGNHVALVESARAGHEARINDSAPRRITMKNPLKYIFGLGLKEFAKTTDDPEAIASAMDAMPTMTEKEVKTEPPKSQLDDDKRHGKDDDDKRHGRDDDRRARMHGALDKILNEYEEKEKAGDVDLGALKDLLNQFFTEEQAEQEHEGDAKEGVVAGKENVGENKEQSEAGAEAEQIDDEEEVKPVGEVKAADDKKKGKDDDDDKRSADDAEIVHPEPELSAKERPESQMDQAILRKAQLQVLKSLRPFAARSKDKAFRNAFDTALRQVREEGDGSGSHAALLEASQRSSASDQLSQMGVDDATPMQKQAVAFDDMYKNAMKARTEKAGVGRR